MKTVDVVKWVGPVVQLIGYVLTGLAMAPWNIFAFFAGILLWIAVGMMWRDRAIIFVHVGAFGSLMVGYLSA